MSGECECECSITCGSEMSERRRAQALEKLCRLVKSVAHRQRSGVGGWKGPALHVPAPTDALAGIPIPHGPI